MLSNSVCNNSPLGKELFKFKLPYFCQFLINRIISGLFIDTLKAFNDFENKQHFFFFFCYVKAYIFWNFIQYTIHWDKIQMLKKFPSEKTLQKMHSLFFHGLQLITVLFLICNSYMSWSTKFISLKLCVGFSIFDSVSPLLKLLFLLNKKHILFDFKTT